MASTPSSASRVKRAHTKGGIEGEVGRSRQRHFVPMPRVRTLAELNRKLEAADRVDLARHIGARRLTVGAMGETPELRLAGIPTVEAVHAFLPVFLERHNSRFAVAAADPSSAWRSWPEGLSADAVFCFHYPRRVGRDSTVSWPGGDLALPRRPAGRSWAGRSVILQERLDGSLWVSHAGATWRRRARPRPDHPWRRYRDRGR